MQIQPVCIGDGLDAASDGVIAAVVLPTAVGLFIWVGTTQYLFLLRPRTQFFCKLLFSVLRPRYRQIYALREWFVQPE